MSESYLTNSRIYFDDDNQIRMLDSESSKITNLLTNQSNEFLKGESMFKPRDTSTKLNVSFQVNV